MAYLVDRTFGKFDPTKPLVAVRQMTLLGNEIKRGDSLVGVKNSEDDSEVPVEILRRLWMTHWADYSTDFTPTAEQVTAGEGLEWMDPAEGVFVTAGDNGWYGVKADWADVENVRGADAAQARAEELRLSGDDKGVIVTATGGGWYTITGTGVDPETPIRVQGAEAAETKAKELRDALPPTVAPAEGETPAPEAPAPSEEQPETPAPAEGETAPPASPPPPAEGSEGEEGKTAGE